MMFDGDTSRWTMPSGTPSGPRRSCAWLRPAAAPATTVSASSSGMRVPWLPAFASTRAQVLAVHVLHREVVDAAVLADLEHLRDVLVVERGGEPRLVQEHLHRGLIVRALRRDQLQHDVALEATDAGACGRCRSAPCRRPRAASAARTCRGVTGSPAAVATAGTLKIVSFRGVQVKQTSPRRPTSAQCTSSATSTFPRASCATRGTSARRSSYAARGRRRRGRCA